MEEEEHNVNVPLTAILGGVRPAKVVLPDNYPQKSEQDDKKLWPMILLLRKSPIAESATGRTALTQYLTLCPHTHCPRQLFPTQTVTVLMRLPTTTS